MPEDLLSQVILQAPNFIGFGIAVVLQYLTIKALVGTNQRLIEAMIKRENCDDEEK